MGPAQASHGQGIDLSVIKPGDQTVRLSVIFTFLRFALSFAYEVRAKDESLLVALAKGQPAEHPCAQAAA